MTAVILTLHTLIVLALIGVVLLQRSDGGALGMGGGGGAGGFMTGRGAANALTKTTTYLAAAFFATSLGLAIFAKSGESAEEVIEELTGETAPAEDQIQAAPTADDLLETLGGAAEDTDAATEAEEGSVPVTEEQILESLGSEVVAPEVAEPEESPAEDEPQQ